MRASSSWIKLQFVVRKHVMNTYQMHTLSLSLFLFCHILTPTLLPLAALLFCLSDSNRGSSAHFLTLSLMVCHTDVTDSALLYNIPLYMYMCMHMVAHILQLHTLHMHLGGLCMCVCVSSVTSSL